MFSTSVLISAALLSTALAGPWANICASKSSNEIRTCDSYGCGQYSAQRTQRHHPGVDVLCSDGSVVYAPFTGTIVRQEKPYRNKNAINNGVRLSGRGLSDSISADVTFFGETDKLSELVGALTMEACVCELEHVEVSVPKFSTLSQLSIKVQSKGEKLGTVLPLQTVYPGIQSHVHIENCDSSDPTAYL